MRGRAEPSGESGGVVSDFMSARGTLYCILGAADPQSVHLAAMPGMATLAGPIGPPSGFRRPTLTADQLCGIVANMTGRRASPTPFLIGQRAARAGAPLFRHAFLDAVGNEPEEANPATVRVKL